MTASDSHYCFRSSVCMEVFHHLWIRWTIFEPWTVYRRYGHYCTSYVFILHMATVCKYLFALEYIFSKNFKTRHYDCLNADMYVKMASSCLLPSILSP